MHEVLGRLTARQKDCLRLVAQGYTSKEIGPRLGISYTTVDNHIRTALDALHVESRAEAGRILIAAEAGQRVTSQPQAIAKPAVSSSIEGAADKPGRSWLQRLVPPLGGSRNELDVDAKAFAILRVAVLGVASLIILTLGVAALLWLIR